MPSTISTLVCSALLAGAVLAAGPTTNFSSTDIKRIIGEVTLTDRSKLRPPRFPIPTLSAQLLTTWRATDSWCDAQHTACGNLCGGQTANNSCTGVSYSPPPIVPSPSDVRARTQATLEWSCTCQSNNSIPGLQYYTPTMYSNLCNKALGDCLGTNAGDRASQENCKSTYVCGSLNASSATAATSTSASATPSATGGATGTTSPSSTPTRSVAMAIRFGEQYGAGALGALVVGALGLAL